jgi:hypothetical protein
LSSLAPIGKFACLRPGIRLPLQRADPRSSGAGTRRAPAAAAAEGGSAGVRPDGRAAVLPVDGPQPALAAWQAENDERQDKNEDRGPDDQLAPLEPIGLHEARHTCASTLIASGANPKVIQKVMGHARIQMTFDHYGHLMPGGLEEAAAAPNAYLARMADGLRPRAVGA